MEDWFDQVVFLEEEVLQSIYYIKFYILWFDETYWFEVISVLLLPFKAKVFLDQ